MRGDKRLLIETLLALAADESPDLLDQTDHADLVRACLLLVASHSPEACAFADRLGYETYDDDTTGTPFQIRGLTLPESGITLREFVEGLNVGLTELPAPFAEATPDLTLEDYRAGIFAIQVILNALEWTSFDKKGQDRYPPENAKSMLAASLRFLNNYRETGKP